MSQTLTNKQKSEATAGERAAAALAGVDLAVRCANLGLSLPDANGSVRLRVLGKELLLTPPDFPAIVASTGAPAKPADRILALHFLLYAGPVEPTGQWISFREFPGGQFYWGPFCSRTSNPLVARIGNDLDRLRKSLDRFDWKPLDIPDLSARIQAVAGVDVALIYRRGDDELGPTAELLFDACAKRIFNAEDAAVLASRVCIGLL